MTGLVLSCLLISQSLLAGNWTRACTYQCVNTEYTMTVDSMSMCPLTMDYEASGDAGSQASSDDSQDDDSEDSE